MLRGRHCTNNNDDDDCDHGNRVRGWMCLFVWLIITSQYILNHHVVWLKYMQSLLVNYTSIKLGESLAGKEEGTKGITCSHIGCAHPMGPWGSSCLLSPYPVHPFSSLWDSDGNWPCRDDEKWGSSKSLSPTGSSRASYAKGLCSGYTRGLEWGEHLTFKRSFP